MLSCPFHRNLSPHAPPPSPHNSYMLVPSPQKPFTPQASQCGWCGSLLNGDSTAGACMSQAALDQTPSLCYSQKGVDFFRFSSSGSLGQGCEPFGDQTVLAIVLGVVLGVTLLNAIALALFVKSKRNGSCAQVSCWFFIALCCSVMVWYVGDCDAAV